MTELRPAPSEETTATESETDTAPPSLIEAEDLIEEISIDGMCGVY